MIDEKIVGKKIVSDILKNKKERCLKGNENQSKVSFKFKEISNIINKIIDEEHFVLTKVAVEDYATFQNRQDQRFSISTENTSLNFPISMDCFNNPLIELCLWNSKNSKRESNTYLLFNTNITYILNNGTLQIFENNEVKTYNSRCVQALYKGVGFNNLVPCDIKHYDDETSLLLDTILQIISGKKLSKNNKEVEHTSALYNTEGLLNKFAKFGSADSMQKQFFVKHIEDAIKQFNLDIIEYESDYVLFSNQIIPKYFSATEMQIKCVRGILEISYFYGPKKLYSLNYNTIEKKVSFCAPNNKYHINEETKNIAHYDEQTINYFNNLGMHHYYEIYNVDGITPDKLYPFDNSADIISDAIKRELKKNK